MSHVQLVYLIGQCRAAGVDAMLLVMSRVGHVEHALGSLQYGHRSGIVVVMQHLCLVVAWSAAVEWCS